MRLPSYVLVSPAAAGWAVTFYCADCDVLRVLSAWDLQDDAVGRAKVEGSRRSVPVYHAIAMGDLRP